METLYRTKLYQNYRGVIISLIDVFIVFCSYGFVFFLDNNFFLESRVLHFTRAIIYGMGFVLLLHLIMQLIFKTHKILWAYTGTSEVFRCGISSLICMVIMLFFTNMFGLFHPSLIVLSEILAFILTLGIRLLYRSILKTFVQTDRKQNALIIGAGSGGYMMLNEIYHNKSIRLT